MKPKKAADDGQVSMELMMQGRMSCTTKNTPGLRCKVLPLALLFGLLRNGKELKALLHSFYSAKSCWYSLCAAIRVR
jgi:hypothetical protein